MLTFNELRNIKAIQPIELENRKFRSHVYYDPRAFSYIFVKCRHENNNTRFFSHIELSEFIFEDLPEEKENIIKKAIDCLHDTSDCWSIEGQGRNTYHAKIIDCQNCKMKK